MDVGEEERGFLGKFIFFLFVVGYMFWGRGVVFFRFGFGISLFIWGVFIITLIF